jgi:hypothetical protein
MNNPTFLQTDFKGNPFTLEVKSSKGYAIAMSKFTEKDGKGVYATPKIEGFIIKDMTVVRKKNLVGEKKETLKFFALNGPPNLSDYTNLRIDLPEGFAYMSEADDGYKL